MKTDKVKKAKKIKKLASNGLFHTIQQKFGYKALIKAKEWLTKKIISFRTSTSSTPSSSLTTTTTNTTITSKNITPLFKAKFISFALQQSSNLDIEQLIHIYENSNHNIEQLLSQDLTITKNSSKKQKVSKSNQEGGTETDNEYENEYENQEFKKKRKYKPRNSPKKPKRRSAYVFFRMDQVKKDPNLQKQTFSEISIEVAKRWQNLDSINKTIFHEMSQEDEKRYQEEMKIYESNSRNKIEISDDKSRKKKKTKDSNDEKNLNSNHIKKIRNRNQNRKQYNHHNCKEYESISEEESESSLIPSQITQPSTHSNDTILNKRNQQNQRQQQLKIKIIPSLDSFEYLEGVKQFEMFPEDDLLHTKLLPKETGTFVNEELIPEIKYMIIIEAYQDFLNSIPENYTNEIDMNVVEKICKLNMDIIEVEFIEQELIELYDCENSLFLLTVQIENQSQEVITYFLLYAETTSTLMKTNSFIISESKYQESLKRSWIVVNSQIKKLFSYDDSSSTWSEGSIYFIRNNWQIHPYNSIKVVWLVQEAEAGEWIYEYLQTDNECSPWDLEQSDYVNIYENVSQPIFPKYLTDKFPQPKNILTYLQELDFSYVFKYDVLKIEEYKLMFPNPSIQLDFGRLNERYKNGQYNCDQQGLISLFTDLDQMISNCKLFNDSNKNFQTWRCADMMEMTIFDLKYLLSQLNDLPLLSQMITKSEDIQIEQNSTNLIEL